MTPAPPAYTQDGAAAATGYSTAIPRLMHHIVNLNPPTIRCDGCGHEATGRTLAMVVQHSGIELTRPATSLTHDGCAWAAASRPAGGWSRDPQHHTTTATRRGEPDVTVNLIPVIADRSTPPCPNGATRGASSRCARTYAPTAATSGLGRARPPYATLTP